MVDNFAAKAGEIVLYWGPPVTRKIMKSFFNPPAPQGSKTPIFFHTKKKITPQDLATSSSFSESSSIITCFAKLLVTTRSGPRFRSKLWTYWKNAGSWSIFASFNFQNEYVFIPLPIQWMMIYPWSMILEWKIAGVIILVSSKKEPWNTSLARYLGFQKKNSAMERHQTNRSEHPGWWTKWTTERFAISALPLVAKTIWAFLRPLEKLYNN